MTSYLGLGSNLGDRHLHLCRALARIEEETGTLDSSPFYETEPVGTSDGEWFLNCVAKITTALSPQELLKVLLSIEEEFGRVRTSKNAPRTLDIDILLYGDEILDEDDLSIPHPQMQKRRFVLQPLADIAPDVQHPILKKSIRELLKECDDQHDIKPFNTAP